MAEKVIENDEIQRYLPHRYPFLLVDRVLEIEDDGSWVVGLKNVSANEPYFQGHFPGRPVMPGVLIVEAMAQVGAVALLRQPENQGKLALFAGIDKARFRQMVLPGDQLRIEVKVLARRGRIGRSEGKAYVGDKLAAEAELLFAVTDAG
ncbi:MAG: 3-hydroxyacyl-ACP dehydratase FabZ [Bacillota bacterium]